MTTATLCPDIEILSQTLDHECSPQEEQRVTQHLSICARCRELMAQLQHASAKVLTPRAHTSALPAAPVPTPACLSPETIAAYVQRVLAPSESIAAEQHLQTCAACFHEVEVAFRTALLLSAPAKKPVPAALKARAAALCKPATAAEQEPTLSRIVIQLAEKGLHLIEHSLFAPFLNLQHVLVQSPTYRSGEAPARLDLKLTAGQHTLAVTAVPDGNGIALTLTLFGPRDERVAGQRMFLHQDNKAILSKKTDQQGVLRVPHLDPGLYEIACPGVAASFAVELRA